MSIISKSTMVCLLVLSVQGFADTVPALTGMLTDLNGSAINCSEQKDSLEIINRGANTSMEEQQIAREAYKCFHKNSKFKDELTKQMKEINPKAEGYKCRLEDNKQVLVLKSWESGRPSFDYSSGEDPIGTVEKDKTMLVRQNISCTAPNTTGLYSGISGGVGLKIEVSEVSRFRMGENSKDDSQTINIKFLGVVQN